MTCRRFIVLRNGEYGILTSFTVLEKTPGVPGLDIRGAGIVSLAKGYGCEAERVTNLAALKAKVATAFRGSRPHVFEVPITPDVPPLF